MPSIGKQTCPCCGQSINKREIGLFKELIEALIEIYKWCQARGTHEFTRKDIKHLLKSDNVIARFGDLKLFGGIVYTPDETGRGHYGINIERMEQFLRNELKIPTKILKNPLERTY